MTYNKIPNTCSQCGAPLTNRENQLICEYCGQEYSIPSFSPDAGHTQKKTENINLQGVEIQQKPYEEQDASEGYISTTSASQPIFSNNREKRVFFAILTIFFLVLCFPLYNVIQEQDASYEIPKNMRPASVTATKRIREYTTSIKMIYQDRYESLEFPSASNEAFPLSSTVVLEYADANQLTFSLFVQNQSEEEINTSTAAQSLDISSLAVSSDVGDEFVCTLKKSLPFETTLRKKEVWRIGGITCKGSLSPASSSIVTTIIMPNWGTWQLSIPIQQNPESLIPRHNILLSDTNYLINIVLYSSMPQLVWVKKSDIFISDNRGNILSLDGCNPTTDIGAGEYFLTLVYPNDYDNYLYIDELIICEFDEPFPSDINTINASLKTTTGKVFTSQAIIDKAEGLILFHEQTAK